MEKKKNLRRFITVVVVSWVLKKCPLERDCVRSCVRPHLESLSMGVCGSKSEDSVRRRSNSGGVSAGNLEGRVQAPPSSMVSVIGDRTRARYAYVSQRGYYPDDLNKANQVRPGRGPSRAVLSASLCVLSSFERCNATQ